MQIPHSPVPWSTPAGWQEANQCLAATIRRRRAAVAGPAHQARRIRQDLESLFPHMNALCRETCPTCTDVCCRRAWVWADFRDLLVCHLAGIAPPDRQLLSRRGDHCRYAAPDGCHLDRLRRPFVCTWYICPSQTRLLQDRPEVREDVVTTLGRIQAARRHLEDRFVQAVR